MIFQDSKPAIRTEIKNAKLKIKSARIYKKYQQKPDFVNKYIATIKKYLQHLRIRLKPNNPKKRFNP